MIIILFTLFVITALFLIVAVMYIYKIQQELISLSEEQHQQNTDIITLLKYKQESSEMILQHIEILKYLVDRDPLLNKRKISMPLGHIVGEA